MKTFTIPFKKCIIRIFVLIYFLINISFSFSQNYRIRIKASINVSGPVTMIGYDSYNNEIPDNENCYNNYSNPCFNYDMTLCSSSPSSMGNIETSRDFNINSIPTEIKGKFYYVASITNNNGCTNGSFALDHKTAISNPQPCQIYTSRVSNTKIELTYAPLTEVIQSDIVNNELTLTDIFNLSFQSGNFIRPKYSLNTGQTWQSFSIPSGGITLEDLGLSNSDFINNNIFFKGSNCLTGESDIIRITFIHSSPQLLSFTPINTQCSYSDDGSFSMNLDKNLESGKKLVVSLFYEFEPVTNPNVFSLLDQKHTTVLADNGNGTYTYQWPSDTPILPGKYKVRYQTYDSSTPNPVWDSLEETKDGFTIGNPPPVSFTATKNNDIYCFGGSDGQINLTASGGVGNFKYELNNNGVWIPFTTTNAHTITGLSKGSKTIKVQDGNGCTQRQ